MVLIGSRLIFCVLSLTLMCVHSVKNNRQSNDTPDLSSLESYINLDSFQLIAKSNYYPERHSVITEDGYKLTLFRIPNKGPPVLLVHGIGDSSDSWVVLGRPDSMAYQLADAGFDVWLYNSRGNKYSHKNIRNISRMQYWNFSYEEMGSKDLPATVDYILLNTFHEKLSYVGFSQGTTIFFVMCALRPEYNMKVKQAILLAPVAWVNKIKYPLLEFITQNIKELMLLADLKGLHELFPSNRLLNLYHGLVCNRTSYVKALCDAEFHVTYGIQNINNLPPERLPIIASHIPSGISTKNIVHFLQGYRSKSFQRFDFGSHQNRKIYGSSRPPAYNLSLVRSPVYLFSSESDRFSSYEDVQILRNKLPNIVSFVVFNKSLDFTHLEFIYGTRVKALINDPVVSLLSTV